MKAKSNMILAMMMFGTIGIFVKNIPLSSGEIALFRAVIAVIILGLYKWLRGGKISFQEMKKELVLLFLSGVAIGFNWILLFQAYKYTTVSLATLSYYFAPVIVMVICPIVWKEKLKKLQILCFIMATLGLILIIGVDGIHTSATTVIGISYGLGAAILYGSVIILNKFIHHITGIDRTIIQFAAAIIVLVPYLLGTTGIHLSRAGGKGILNLLILGIVHTGIAYCLYFSAVKEMKGQEVAILSYIDPFVAIICSVTMLGETMNIVQVIGGILILGFTCLNEWKHK